MWQAVILGEKPTRVDSMKYNITEPFRVLLALRDGYLTHIEQLTSGVSPTTDHYVEHYVSNLNKYGIVQFNRSTGELKPKKKFFDSMTAIGVSLSNLCRYNRNTILAEPLWHKMHLRMRNYSSDVFVLMPFSQELCPIYEDHIKNVVGKYGVGM